MAQLVKNLTSLHEEAGLPLASLRGFKIQRCQLADASQILGCCGCGVGWQLQLYFFLFFFLFAVLSF